MIGRVTESKGADRFSLVLAVRQGIRQFSRGVHRRFILASPNCAILAAHESAKYEK
jgi:hypothetical protein